MNSKLLVVATVSLGLALGGAATFAAQKAGERKKAKPQTNCPVMGGKINKKLYVDYGGKRIYACCPGCLPAIKKDPQKYIRKLEAQGITLERAPVALCPKCGEILGSAKCCNPKGRTRCPKCGLFKGSPGCCKIPKGTKEPVLLCPKCGEILGSDACCKLKAQTSRAGSGASQGWAGCCPMR